jgi:acetyl-CoA carboxylase carboxyl transferase subunit alpha
MAVSFDFEKGIPELEARIADLRRRRKAGHREVGEEIARLEGRLDRALRQTYQRLGAWQKLQVARHPSRPKTHQYLESLVAAFTPLGGADSGGNTAATVGGLCRFRGFTVVVFGHDKRTSGTETGASSTSGSEGYRVAARLQHLADAFTLPMITFIHAPATDPDEAAPELGEAIGNALVAALDARGPRVAVIVGEGIGRGALALAVADRVLMLEHAVLSAVAPERAARLQWGDESQARAAADALKITAADLLAQGIIDEIVAEPAGGAHRNPAAATAAVGDAIEKALRELTGIPENQRRRLRRERYLEIGVGGLG